MTYELLKQLKEAGFPIKSTRLAATYLNIGNKGSQQIEGDEVFYPPTLDELIDACGDVILEVHKNSSVAFNTIELGKISIKGEGSIPLEAVANLWLNLHKK